MGQGHGGNGREISHILAVRSHRRRCDTNGSEQTRKSNQNTLHPIRHFRHHLPSQVPFD